jgi:hypothetical protein
MLNWKTILCISLMLLCLIVLVIPWQLVPLSRDLQYIYKNSILVGVFAPLLYLLIRAWRLRPELRWILLIPGTLLMLAGMGFLFLNLSFYTPAQNRYMLLYTREGKSSETIEIIHNHIFTTNWNESKHIIDFPGYGFRLSRSFKRKNLNGRWVVNKDNPYHPEGVFSFKNGEIINP